MKNLKADTAANAEQQNLGPYIHFNWIWNFEDSILWFFRSWINDNAVSKLQKIHFSEKVQNCLEAAETKIGMKDKKLSAVVEVAGT